MVYRLDVESASDLGAFFFVYTFWLFIFISMIAIAQGANVLIYITLTDKRETSSNVYEFRFNHEVTNEQVDLTLTDVSDFKQRVSVFTITSGNFDESTVGFWRYNVTQEGSGADVIATGKMELTAPNLSTTGVVRYNGYNGDFKTYTTT